ncbi:MAG: RdgB/HAM1 family non-canonical purine NTP pyrophosphatase [Spirochaetaceae bacterium]|jgi:XTP/dITP diphosphohydrolase|nr:RdgB/HAM1 family non-canonical purine NTP pyrophosphatase [Spirochaetaceae bacterium]
MTIWFASGNAHKKQELLAVLSRALSASGAAGLTLRIPSEQGIHFEPEETGATFLENALIKARALFALTGEPVIADDSGLCVDALGGRPGIYSARYRGPHPVCAGLPPEGAMSAAERNALLLQELGGASCRTARFVCAMVLLTGAERFFAAQETLEGEIVRGAGRGEGGFGYDPLLWIPPLGKTAAELDAEQKNRISHRGKAARALAGHVAAAALGGL